MDGVNFESRVRGVVGGQVRGVKQRRQKQAEGRREGIVALPVESARLQPRLSGRE